MADPGLEPVDLAEVTARLASLGNPWVSSPTSMTILTEADRRVRLGVPLPPEAELSQVLAASSQLASGKAALAASSVGARCR